MKSRKIALLIFSLMIIPNVGCQSWTYVRDSIFFCEPIDGAIHSHNCHRAAKRAWAERYDHYCDRECADYFGAGFRDGYADVARGGTGCPPPLPPRRYWGWRYQNALGQQRVAAWFDGYPAGARAAEEDGVANWSRMQTSYIIDAQYAARMNGGRRGGPLPATGAFPGEELEEVPAPAADAAPETVVPNTAAPDAAVPGATLPETPVPAPAEPPAGSSTSAREKPEEVQVLRNLDQAMPVSSKVADQPKVRLIPQIVAAPTKRQSIVTAIEPIEASPLSENLESEPAASEPIVSEAKLPSPVRDLTATEAPVEDSAAEVKDLPMPAVEILSGLSVPKKQTALVEEVTEVEMAESDTEEDAEEFEMPLAEEIVTSKQPALVRSPALTPIETPENRSSAAPTAGIVGESPAYNLGSNEASSAGPTSSASSSNTTTNSTKRTLPPIVPSKPKKLTTPIVRPVEAPGRLTRLASPLPAKQVSFESDEDEEVPGLRRIGKSK